MSGKYSDLLQIEPDSGEPLVRQIQRMLRREIGEGRLPAGEQLPSMRQIADDLGVSLGIVKQALNTLTSEGYLKSSPRRGVFVSRPRSSVRDVALVLPMLTNEQMVRVIAGVRKGLAGTNLRLVIQAADADYETELHLLEYLDPALVAGAIIYPPGVAQNAEPLARLRDRGIPVVQVVQAMDYSSTDAVVVDGFQQGRTAMKYLLDKGHRRIGFVDTTADAATFDEIREGMQAALEATELSWEDLRRVALSEADLDADTPWANGERAANLLLGNDQRANQRDDQADDGDEDDDGQLTALIGINPHITLGCYRAARAAGRKIGIDISVLAMGSDLPTFALLQPSISVVDSPMEAIGERAARRLVKLMDGESDSSRVIELPPKLVERESVHSVGG